jgi:predicted nucleic acid-binding protein
MDKKTGITSRLSPSVHLLARHAVEGAGVFDLQIVATMLANGVQRIYTFNRGDFQVFAELTVVAPT